MELLMAIPDSPPQARVGCDCPSQGTYAGHPVAAVPRSQPPSPGESRPTTSRVASAPSAHISLSSRPSLLSLSRPTSVSDDLLVARSSSASTDGFTSEEESEQSGAQDSPVWSELSLSATQSESGFEASLSATQSESGFDTSESYSQPVRKTKQSHARKRPPGHVKRPPNAFILFRSHCISPDESAYKEVPATPSLDAAGAGDEAAKLKDHCTISRIVSVLWKSLSAEDKAYWSEQARLKREEHERLHPDYKYRPIFRSKEAGAKPKRLKKVKKEEDAVKAAEESEAVAINILVNNIESLGKLDISTTGSSSFERSPHEAFQTMLENVKTGAPPAPLPFKPRRRNQRARSQTSSSASSSSAASVEPEPFFASDSGHFYWNTQSASTLSSSYEAGAAPQFSFAADTHCMEGPTGSYPPEAYHIGDSDMFVPPTPGLALTVTPTELAHQAWPDVDRLPGQFSQFLGTTSAQEESVRGGLRRPSIDAMLASTLPYQAYPPFHHKSPYSPSAHSTASPAATISFRGSSLFDSRGSDATIRAPPTPMFAHSNAQDIFKRAVSPQHDSSMYYPHPLAHDIKPVLEDIKEGSSPSGPASPEPTYIYLTREQAADQVLVDSILQSGFGVTFDAEPTLRN